MTLTQYSYYFAYYTKTIEQIQEYCLLIRNSNLFNVNNKDKVYIII